MSGITVGILSDDEMREINNRLVAASTSPWRVENDHDLTGENWFLFSCGTSGIDGKDYYVTTDHVHASEYDGDAKTDAEFIVWCRNDMAKIARAYLTLRDVAEKLYEACADAEAAYERVMDEMQDLDDDKSRLAIALLFASVKRCAQAAKQARGE